MQRIDFFQLERPIQERFVASARGAAPPAPLASFREPVPRSVVLWAAISVFSMVGLVLFGAIGYGELDSGFALQPGWVMSVYAALGVLAVFAGFRAAALHLHVQSLPYAPAVYLFPSGLVDTRGTNFVVRPLADLRRVKVGSQSLVASFADGSSYRFKISDRARGQEIEELLGRYGARLSPDSAPISAREIAAWDPLKDNGFSNPFSPSEKMKQPKLRFRVIAPLVAIASGPLLGFGAYALRNYLAEDALYRSARGADNGDAYRAYVARGGKRSEIEQILLPRSELAQVVEKGELAAIEAYALPREKSAIWPEIERALQRALLTELENVKKQGSRARLRDFQSKYGKHAVIAPAIERAVSEHRARALSKFAAEAKPSAEVLDFFRRLLVYADTHGPKVELRYQRKLADSVARTENQLRKSVFFGGEPSLPAQYFDAKRSVQREAELSKLLIGQFARAFPSDLLSLEPAALFEDAGEELPKVTVPTLLVTHRTEMSGAYLSTQPRAAYTGIGVLFRVSLQIPDDATPHVYKSSSWYAPALREIRNGASFESIYEEMATKAFTKVWKRYLAELFPGFAS
jgi:hypothetical protein